jgi:hypothetical protein
MLGHKSIKITEIYAKILDKKKGFMANRYYYEHDLNDRVRMKLKSFAG